MIRYLAYQQRKRRIQQDKKVIAKICKEKSS